MDSSLANSSLRERALLAALIAGAALIALCVWASPSPAAPEITGGFSWTPSTPHAGDSVTFSANVSPSDGATITQYRWDLDGTGGWEQDTGTTPSAVREYLSPTNLRVRLQVKDSAGKGRTFKRQLSVLGSPGSKQAPVASFGISPAAPIVNQPVLFTSTSSDADGTVTEQAWDLNGDGNFDNGGGTTALRTFSAPGEYAVGLRVTDNDGLISFDSQTVGVLPAPGFPVTTKKTGPAALSPFPVVRMAGRVTPFGTRVRLLQVVTPVGARISLRCAGRSCPFKKQVRAVSSDPKLGTARSVRVRRLERLLLPGVRIRIYVTKPGAIGKYTRFRFRKGKPPARTDRCLLPGSWAPAQCPSA